MAPEPEGQKMTWLVEVQGSMMLDEDLGEEPRLVWLPVGEVEVGRRTRHENVMRAAAEKFGLTPESESAPPRVMRIVDPGRVKEGELAAKVPPPPPAELVVTLR